jgi:hypothetical protein
MGIYQCQPIGIRVHLGVLVMFPSGIHGLMIQSGNGVSETLDDREYVRMGNGLASVGSTTVGLA